MKDFLKTTLASIVGVVSGILILLFVLATYFVEDPPPELPASGILVLDSSLFITEQGSPGDFAALIGEGEGPSIPLHEFLHGLETARLDGRIEGVLLLETPQLPSMAAVEQVHDALMAMRRAGKDIYSFASGHDMASFALASSANIRSMPPRTLLDLSGYSAEMMYYADAMEKLGVEVQVTRVGRYKSAVEPFLLSASSPENMEQMRTLLESAQEAWLTRVSDALSLDRDWLGAQQQQLGLWDAEAAAELGLIDQVQYFDQLLEGLIERFGEDPEDPDTFAQFGIRRYLDDNPPAEPYSAGATIMVIHAQGEIWDGWTEEGIGGDSLAYDLRMARLDPWVDAVVLRVDSPGGSATASETILREMRLLTESGKPVVVSMASMAASGGYWISCLADRIYASPTTLTGSIGVFGMFPNISGLMEEVGLHVDTVRSAPHADLFTLYRAKTQAELDLIQVHVDSIYEDFLDRVVEGRGLERAAVHEIAQGRVWSGADALELGLVDALGGLDAAIAGAAELLEVEDYDVDYLDPYLDPFDELIAEALEYGDDPVAGLKASPSASLLQDPQVASLLQGFRELSHLLLEPGVKARLPYSVTLR